MGRENPVLVWGVGKGEKGKRAKKKEDNILHVERAGMDVDQRHCGVHFCSIILGTKVWVRRFSVNVSSNSRFSATMGLGAERKS